MASNQEVKIAGPKDYFSRAHAEKESALNSALYERGATTGEVQAVNRAIIDLIKAAEIKQEDMSNKIELLRKLEIRFNELYEKRKNVTDKTEAALIESHEADLNKRRNDARRQRQQDAERDAITAKRSKMENDTAKRRAKLKNTGRRAAARSEKPTEKTKEDDKPIINKDEEDMLKYLGIHLQTG